MTTASMSVAISSGIGMIGSAVTVISQVFTAVNTIVTIFDIIKTIVDLTNDPITMQKIKTEATKYFTDLASSTVADYMVLKEKDFWIASAASFSRNLDEIGMAIVNSNLVMNDIRNGIRRCSTPGMPRIIIQLPHPENAVIPKVVIPLPGVKVKLGPMTVGLAIQIGSPSKYSGRLLGFAIQTDIKDASSLQVLRQDYHSPHHNPTSPRKQDQDFTWNDDYTEYVYKKITTFKFHYHVPR
jgi:hypothetical protein